MGSFYGKMMDSAFSKYYERFKELNALSKENAVTINDLFPNNSQTYIDRDRMHKMLSSNIVKRVNHNKYWLDEAVATNPRGVLKQRLWILLIILGAGVVMLILKLCGLLV